MLPGKIKIYDIKISIIKYEKTWRKDIILYRNFTRRQKNPLGYSPTPIYINDWQLIFLKNSNYLELGFFCHY